ncbi:penicillin-binding protein activator [Alteromonas sp. BL110]|uniref:penicillin-binding protein activator n=1 Tax=Alteromonas sp. BL110 TaxID=1714845 RepID=UPI000E4ADA23|nr:penicillin-binding protein activator [Alteromonas sp. BL110]AXT39388.1 penicillin-binding protein activator [Alteromonas sp. BL110]RKM82126.1 penicillin-binding protein activator [Alteromonas sp. BL110]
MRHIGQSGKIFTLSAIASVLVLSGCGSTPKTQSKPVVVEPSPIETTQVEQNVTPEHKLLEAKRVWERTRNKEQRNSLLLQAADLYLQNQQPVLAQQVLFEVKEDGVSERNHSYYSLLVTKAYAGMSDASADELLAMLDGVTGTGETAFQKAELQTQLYSQQGNFAAAANSVLQTNLPDEDKVQQVWQWLTSIPTETLTTVGKAYPALSPFITLRELTEANASSPATLARELQKFQQVYQGHMLETTLPDNVLKATQLTDAGANDIAVLLPLSGRLARTGQVVKNGIMSAYYTDVEKRQDEHLLPRLRFIDTNGVDTQHLLNEIGDTKFIVGPLLKDTVEKLIPNLHAGVNVLALNRPEERIDQVAANNISNNNTITTSPSPALNSDADMPESILTATDTQGELDALGLATSLNYFGLAPEDEAKQLAEYIFNKGYRAPIVIAAQSSLYQRMDTTFKTHWRALNNKENKRRANITSVTFNDSNSLREGITQALDVAQSNDRINQIEYMTNDEVYNMPRSRRDIDAIVAFASPQDTELLNPIIEASLNPYDGKQVPVYATSRSMDYDSGKNQWRDLQNVHFIDMPWLMPSHNWQPLQQEVEQAWQNQNTMQKRLFAFGFDAYQLLPQLGMLNTLKYLSHEGLTGTLSLNERGEVIRQQPQAMIRNEKVYMLSE